MWRVGFDNPADFSDNEGFCGGFRHQHGSMGGKCGICGDPWDGPRDHEAPGGIFANGLITRTYQPGDDIDVEVDVTANHKGHFVFKLCANNNLFSDPDQDCFDKTVLEVLPHMEPQFNVTTANTGTYALKLRLPANVTCKQCILQWTYTCGNNWGVCPDGVGALGCGPQEMFRACSDIAIEGTPVNNDNSISDEKEVSSGFGPQGVSTHQGSNGENMQCQPVPPYDRVPGMTDWCEINCSHVPRFCPPSHCQCE